MLALDPTDDGRMPYLIDLHSTNRTYVNGRAVHRKHVLPGDTIVIGRTRFEIRRLDVSRPHVVELPEKPPERPPGAGRISTKILPAAAGRPAFDETALGPAPLLRNSQERDQGLDELLETLSVDNRPRAPQPTASETPPPEIVLEPPQGSPAPATASPEARPASPAADEGEGGRAEAEPELLPAAEAVEPETEPVLLQEEPDAQPAAAEGTPTPSAIPPADGVTELVFGLTADDDGATPELAPEPEATRAIDGGRLARPAALAAEGVAAKLLAQVPRDYSPFFGFRERPFGQTADPDYLFHGQCHWDALMALARWLKTGPPLAVLFGEAGCGKTLLVACLARRLAALRTPAVVIRAEPEVATPEELIAAAASRAAELGEPPPQDGQSPPETWRDTMGRLRRRNALAVFLIDDAHHMPQPALKGLAGLLEDLTAREGARLLLAGDETLREAVAVPPLCYHVGISCYLAPMDVNEVAAYVAHRLCLVSEDRNLVFTRRAVELIATYSGGVPRLVNSVADAALFYAFRSDRHQVSHDVVAQAIAEVLDGDVPQPPREDTP
jgi:type II secretory pathway predicted ATPase ExeA